MVDQLLLPEIDETNRPFWQGCRDGVLRIQRCTGTGRLIHPPRVMSPWDNSAELDWTEVSGEGRIWSIVSPHPPLIAQFSALAPYNAILVELIEDPRIRLIGNLVAAVDQPINSVSLDRAAIGDRVRVVFQDEADDWVMPRWQLC
ncbi:Zn-ribbon domain-containing OB-fold protein [Parahaliea mediterranea]|uniref:OB-fold domain-containing protein n=1 Tax=Parahaliea mediterranea TaxID=651086 RepID=A0A939DEW7_9GAMM|nr:OB-fold domain-containing protein [Parahaliea mediterranea]MBN7796926.1 OB-fold domain-containing protein [Parahaliea mediterranea]